MLFNISISKRFLFSFLFVFVLSLAISPAQTKKGQPIELEYADQLVGTKDSAIGNTRDFIGNVRFKQGNVRVSCNSARQFLNENRVELQGNVVIKQKTLTLSAPKIDYDGNTYIAIASGGVKIVDKETTLTAEKGQYSTQTQIADFTDHVRIDDDSATITSNYITHSRISRESSAYGKVKIVGRFTNAILSGDTLLNIPAKNYSIAKGNPILYQIDTANVRKYLNDSTKPFDSTEYIVVNKYDTLGISSEIMEAFREPSNERYLFHGKAEITRGGVATRSDEAVYMKSMERMDLMGTPIVWYDSTQLHSDSVSIFLPGKKLNLIHAINNAIALSRNDTTDLKRINQIAGNELKISLNADTITSMVSYGAAQSLYFMSSEKGSDGLSRSASDTIIVEFNDGQPYKIYWLKGIPGDFVPEIQIVGKPESFYLQRFKWSEGKPVKKKIK